MALLLVLRLLIGYMSDIGDMNNIYYNNIVYKVAPLSFFDVMSGTLFIQVVKPFLVD